MTLRSRVLAALGTVYDPELDEPIIALGFVGSCVVTAAGDVDVRLRLPTPQCAPNFAFLMAADARAAVRRLPGVGEVTVVLEDHYTGAEINAAVGRGAGFDAAFPGETAGDLDALRELFRRKALLARQARLCQALVGAGASPEAVVSYRVADLPATPDAVRSVALRAALGLPHGADAPALVTGDGAALTAQELPAWLRRARLVSLSLETNGGMCRDLLKTRYAEGVAA
ncbi:MAG: iron-sulfur cluster assembly protein [Solirubrobacteraceae bacterium]